MSPTTPSSAESFSGSVEDAEDSVSADAAGPDGPGWWQASDGNWYPPESHPGSGEPGSAEPVGLVAGPPLDVAADARGLVLGRRGARRAGRRPRRRGRRRSPAGRCSGGSRRTAPGRPGAARGRRRTGRGCTLPGRPSPPPGTRPAGTGTRARWSAACFAIAFGAVLRVVLKGVALHGDHGRAPVHGGRR